MEKQITYENLSSFAYTNDAICQKPICGIVLAFSGLGRAGMVRDDTAHGLYFAKYSILYINPYVDPWCWMNKQAVAFTDELIDAVFTHYGLPEDFPIVSTGGSMGGQCALVYSVYAKRAPIACVANAPVCDVPYHFTERDDLPRTFYNALFGYAEPLEAALRSISPIDLVDRMPDIPYSIFHGECDKAVDLQMHSARFFEKMKANGKNITLTRIPMAGHCQLVPPFENEYLEIAKSAILARKQ